MDTQLIKAAVGSVVRHAGTLLAGWLFAQGYIDEGTMTEVVAFVMAGGVLAWSVVQKQLAAKSAD